MKIFMKKLLGSVLLNNRTKNNNNYYSNWINGTLVYRKAVHVKS